MDVHSHAHHMEIGEESVVWSMSFQLPEKNALQPVSYLGGRVQGAQGDPNQGPAKTGRQQTAAQPTCHVVFCLLI